MKKIFLFILLMSAGIFAQAGRGVSVGDGNIWSDSLKSGVDTTNVHDVGLRFRLFSLMAADTGSVYADSVDVKIGFIYYRPNGTAYDTLWATDNINVKKIGDLNFRKNIISGANKNTLWFFEVPVCHLIKVDLINAQYIAGRKFRYILTGTK